MIQFEVLGEPQGKQRPRFKNLNSKVITYTPSKTAQYENLVKASYRQVSDNKFQKGTPLELTILAFFGVPKSASRVKHRQMVYKEILPTKKPDSDNIIKIICDALNGLAYEDDSQVCRVLFDKSYAETPKVKIEIREIKKGEAQ